MVNFGAKEVFRSETRKNVRVNDHLTLSWQIKEDNLQGKAKIRNISSTGMMIETKVNLPAYDNFLFTFEPPAQVANAIPLQGRRVWSKKVNHFFGNSLIGIEFVNPAQDVIANLRERISARVERIKNIERLENIAGFTLIASMILIAGFALTQQSLIQRNYEQTAKLLLISSAQQADLFDDMVADLKMTKTLLAETQTLLAQAKEENAALLAQLGTANANLQALNQENERLGRLVSSLEERLKPFEAEIASLEDGKSFMTTVKKRYKAIKIGIYKVKRQAILARAAAQKERDAILLAQGNRGYIIKDSQYVADHFSEAKKATVVLPRTQAGTPAAVQAAPSEAVAGAQTPPTAEKKVKIDVTILDGEK